MHAFRPLSLFVCALVAALPAPAAIPSVINYQGRLTDGSPTPVPVNATVNMTFEIWDVQAGGVVGVNRLWLEPASGSTPIQVVNGIFSVQLGASAGGSSVPIPDTLFSGSDTRYLQIIVNGETLAPRQRITSTGYANQAAFSLQADSATAANNSLQLGGVAASGWQRALSPASCPGGQNLTGIAQNGTATCAGAQLTPPVSLSAAVAASNGVLGATNTGTGSGLYGENSTTNSGAFGVHGKISSTTPGGNSAAVRGENSGAAGLGIGVWGSHNGGGFGVYGTTAGGGRAVYGLAGSSGTGVYGSSTSGNGVTGTSGSGYGLYGTSSSDHAIVGLANGTTGVLYGVSGSTASSTNESAGVYGVATSSSGYVYGVAGVATASGIGGTGVYGTGGQYGGYFSTPSGTAVYAVASSPGSAYAYYGSLCCAGGTYAGYFYGNVHVSGNLSKLGGSFKIDHPLDPENKYLYHSFMESPDMKNFYDGVVVLDARGEAEVVMPAWFGALNRDFRYQLTCIGGHAPVFISEELNNNRFRIAGGRPGLKVSWAVTGIRKDAYADRNRIPVEEDKPARERGTYLRPDVYDLPPERGLDWLNRPAHKPGGTTAGEPGAPAGPSEH